MSSRSNWWQAFFSDIWLDVQRKLMTEEQTHAEADFIREQLRLTPKAKVLDVPCGNGRLSIELAHHGYKLKGMDIAVPLLEDARQEAAQQNLTISWEQRDMQNLPWKEEFDGVFCFWSSFGFFDDDNNEKFLKAVFRCLKPGAKFLLDTHVTETLLPKFFEERGWRRVGDILVLEERCYDHESSRTETEWILVKGNRVFKTSSSVRLYTYRELCFLFDRAGFKDLEGYGSLTGEPFKLGSPRLYLVATRLK